jgi:Ca2+-binding RTX toxin-like protein
MATHYLNKSISKTWEIDQGGDVWVLGEDGRITGTNFTGIRASSLISTATIRVDGDILLIGWTPGLDIHAGAVTITVGKKAHIDADVAIHHSNEFGSVSIYNRGWLEGNFGISAFASQGGAAIRNSGTIDAVDGGICLGGAGATIVNSGKIEAANGIFVASGNGDTDPLNAANATRIVNEGDIVCVTDGDVIGAGFSIQAQNVAVHITNTGLLGGTVLLGDGDDVLLSMLGTVQGNIIAGGGNDVVNMRGSHYTGSIFGGDGDDIVTLASADAGYVENDHAGTDLVRVDASYALGLHVENMVLLGAGNHTGAGNSLDNWLRGNCGVNSLFGMDGDDRLDGRTAHDTLTGGAGADCFVFKCGYGSDTIMDFTDGSDRIDLSGFTGIDDFGDLAGKIAEKGDNLVIAFNDTDRLVLKNAAADGAELSAADFIF